MDDRCRSGLLSVLLVLLEATMLQRRLKNMTQGSVSASKPFSSQSELRPDKLFQDQPILWFYLQTRLSTRGHCVSVSGLTHLHEGAVSSLFSSIVKKKNHKSEISWQKNVYSLKKIHLIFFHSCFFLTRIFFHLVLNRKYFFSYENTIQKVKHFYDTSEKKNTLCFYSVPHKCI